MDQLKQQMDDLTEMFTAKMTTFEDSLGSHGQTPDTSSLASDFYNFKNFIWKAVSALKAQMELVIDTLDTFEMRSRINVLLLHGVPETPSEDLESYVVGLCHNQLLIPEISLQSFATCLRLGRGTSSDKPRPILLRFCDYRDRNSVWMAKRKLKGSGIVVSEFLTSARHAVFVEARKVLGVKNCWTSDGRVVVTSSDGSRQKVTTMTALRKVLAAYNSSQTQSGNSASVEDKPQATAEEAPSRPSYKTRSVRIQQQKLLK